MNTEDIAVTIICMCVPACALLALAILSSGNRHDDDEHTRYQG